MEDDPGFREFVDVHKNRSLKSTWSNDDQLGRDVDNKKSKDGNNSTEIRKSKKDKKLEKIINSVSDLDVSQ